MASSIDSISSVSYLYPSAYQSVATPSAASTPGSEQSVGFSAYAELQAMQQQGQMKSFFNDSLAAALLQPATGINSGTAMTTLVNNMLQQVVGAYQTQIDASK